MVQAYQTIKKNKCCQLHGCPGAEEFPLDKQTLTLSHCVGFFQHEHSPFLGVNHYRESPGSRAKWPAELKLHAPFLWVKEGNEGADSGRAAGTCALHWPRVPTAHSRQPRDSTHILCHTQVPPSRLELCSYFQANFN